MLWGVIGASAEAVEVTILTSVSESPAEQKSHWGHQWSAGESETTSDQTKSQTRPRVWYFSCKHVRGMGGSFILQVSWGNTSITAHDIPLRFLAISDWQSHACLVVGATQY